MSLTKENQAKAEEILLDEAGCTKALAMGIGVSFKTALSAMEAYATPREQQAVKKVLFTFRDMALHQKIERPVCDEDSMYNAGLIDLIRKLDELEPDILLLLNGGEEWK